LMPQVFSLLHQEQELLKQGAAPRLLEAASRTAITAGWLSYNVNNRGDAEAYWTYAETLARDLGSNELLAYALGVRSSVYSTVPKRAGYPADVAATRSLLEEAISIAKVGAGPALRAWLYSRRAEEHAVLGDRRAAY